MIAAGETQPVAGPMLTDDELVWLSVQASVPFPGVLPTVDDADESGLLRAAARGLRSLTVRGLVDPDLVARGEGPIRIPLVDDLVGGPRAMLVYRADAEGLPVTFDHAKSLLPVVGGWMIDELGDAGIHSFLRAGQQEVDTWLSEECRRFWSGGVPRDQLGINVVEQASRDHLCLGR